MTHVAVMLQEVVDAFKPLGTCALIIDATFGRGGHARALLNILDDRSKVVSADWDEAAEAVAQALATADQRFSFVRTAFADLPQALRGIGIDVEADGVLVDLGVSSPMLDAPERGFSLRDDGPLDMRMDQRGEVTAADLINRSAESELADQFYALGDERYSRRIARAIISARNEEPIRNTLRLAEVVAAAHPRWPRHHHPATRVFQALRMWVNGEVRQLEVILAQLPTLLRPGGRAVIISFHSGDDRRVKHAFRRNPEVLDPRVARMPPARSVSKPARHMRQIGRAIKASMAEVEGNPRARSAVMRVAECCA